MIRQGAQAARYKISVSPTRILRTYIVQHLSQASLMFLIEEGKLEWLRWIANHLNVSQEGNFAERPAECEEFGPIRQARVVLFTAMYQRLIMTVDRWVWGTDATLTGTDLRSSVCRGQSKSNAFHHGFCPKTCMPGKKWPRPKSTEAYIRRRCRHQQCAFPGDSNRIQPPTGCSRSASQTIRVPEHCQVARISSSYGNFFDRVHHAS